MLIVLKFIIERLIQAPIDDIFAKSKGEFRNEKWKTIEYVKFKIDSAVAC